MAEVIDQEMAKKFMKAKSNVLLDDPFYGYILLRHEIIQTRQVKTASINGQSIKYNPDFIRPLTQSQLKGLLKHEVMHIASMHHCRRGTRKPKEWNDAGDYAINNHLIKAGETIPDGGLVNPAYNGFSTEHIYSMLPPAPPGGGGSSGGNQPGNAPPDPNAPPPPTGFSGWGDVEDHPNAIDESSRDLVEQDTKLDVIQAYNTAKIQGKVPLGIESLVDKIRESKMPWRRILARFFRASAKSRENWKRPNKRFIDEDIYLPTKYSKTMGPVAIAIDTSGSISLPELETFFGCVNSILKHSAPSSIHVIYCDAKVQHVDVLTPQDLPLTVKKLKRHGMGGTEFEPVFEHIKENNINPDVLLYMTDMYGSFDFDKPAYPTIWCATSEIRAPWGQTIEIIP